MACFGSKTLRRKEIQPRSTSDMSEEENSSRRRGKKNDKSTKPREKHSSLPDESSSKQKHQKKSKDRKEGKRMRKSEKDGFSKGSLKMPHGNEKSQWSSKHPEPSKSLTPVLRKRVDPETVKYFSEIANLFESNAIDLEERSAICGNALEETRGKELELTTDNVISRTLQTLLEGCDLDQLCGFLHNCADVFPTIGTDKFGSHVAETALRSLATHLQDEGSYSYIEEALTKICEVVALDAVNMMRNSYGSHVLRSLLCLCRGVPLDSLEEFHVTKPSVVLAERLNPGPAQSVESNFKSFENGFPVVFKFLVSEILSRAKDEITSLRVEKYCSFVLQTVLKLSIGDDQQLLHTITIILGSHEEDIQQKESGRKQEIMLLVEDTASSHLLEVIIEVAPETMYSELLTEMFKGSLFEISSHHCGNFVVQALISSARSRDQMKLIWEELGPKLKELLEAGKSGVVASILAACQRHQINGHECCHALATAVNSDSGSPSCIVPHILFLESYFREKSGWQWHLGEKMHVLGCLILQTIFKFRSQYIQPFIASMISMDDNHMFQTAKDAGGGRVLEAFLSSDASSKLKLKVIAKLRGHYGELAMNNSFTVEKCFAMSNISLKEAMAAEMLAVQAELAKTRHGPYLLKKLDIDGFARRPEQWKLSQASKETAYREFQAAFGSISKPLEQNVEPESSERPLKRKHKGSEKMNNNIDQGHGAYTEMPSLSSFPGLENSMAKLGFSQNKKSLKRQKSAKVTTGKEPDSKKFIRNSASTPFVRESGKRKSSVTELADLASKTTLSAGEVRKLFKPSTENTKNQSLDERVPFLKKQKR
ncbi:pumilio homolog 23 [Typha latifolia]|uniref:pumilio homolog 23 n=1 Tax=Typha latifolia TaxID=4733 RepID=UPI003C2CFB1E